MTIQMNSPIFSIHLGPTLQEPLKLIEKIQSHALVARISSLSFKLVRLIVTKTNVHDDLYSFWRDFVTNTAFKQ